MTNQKIGPITQTNPVIPWFSPAGTNSLRMTTKFNVDDITLLKDFFESYLFLPQVKLQKHNATKERVTSADNEYLIMSSYTYQNDLPVNKTSLVAQTKGGNRQTQVSSQYTYY